MKWSSNAYLTGLLTKVMFSHSYCSPLDLVGVMLIQPMFPSTGSMGPGSGSFISLSFKDAVMQVLYIRTLKIQGFPKHSSRLGFFGWGMQEDL